MLKSLSLVLTAALALQVLATTRVQAAPGATPVLLEAVVVTPTARYTASQWQARVASRHALTLERVIVTPKARYSVAEWQANRAAAAPPLAVVMLEPVIVTPTARYTAAEWRQRQAGLAYAKSDANRRSVSRWLNAVWKHFNFKRTPVEV